MSPRTRPKLFSSGAVVVRETGQGLRFLMLRAFRHWDFPKGIVEPGEGPKEAAIREVREETSIADLEFAWGNIYLETGPYSRGKVARYYLARTATSEVHIPPSPDTGRPEHNEIRWVSLREARRLAAPRVLTVVNWAAGRLGLGA